MAIKVYVNDNGTPTLVEMAAESAEALAKLVSAAQAQDFTETEKAQARENIGALGVGETINNTPMHWVLDSGKGVELRLAGNAGTRQLDLVVYADDTFSTVESYNHIVDANGFLSEHGAGLSLSGDTLSLLNRNGTALSDVSLSQLITSVDGLTGAVDLSSTYLKTTGGTITGRISFSTPYAINATATDSFVSINGGTNNSTGSYIQLYGADHATYAGYMKLTTRDGTNSKELVLNPDGALTWQSHSVYQYLNLSTSTNVAVDGTEATIPYDGLLYVWGQRSSSGAGTVTVRINGYAMPTLITNNYSWVICSYPVEKGQTVTITQTNVTTCGAKLYSFK